ncbi:MAG: hypothetical protein JNL70_09275 [Saprospiraceae bacterium]|nr:hypothetical protein [Saprospiraceae bacterium]
MRNFENWETQDLETEFGLVQDYNSTLLNDWLSATATFDDVTKKRLDKLSNKYFEYADYWNEDELKMQGISPILDIVDYSSRVYTVFSQRPLSATINGIEIGGRVDFMIAKGKQKPIQPYFFIHEYKQETKRGSSDPKGQLLSELLVAQHRNNVEFPMYGCYVIGRNWFFVVLNGKDYAVSDAFVASQKDIYQIVAILNQVKTYINQINGN